MSSEDRLAKLFEKGGVSFSIETLENALALITITRKSGTNQDTVGGSYYSIEEGINDCIDKLDEISRNRSGLKVVK